MKPLHWAVVAALVLGIPVGYGGLLAVGIAIGVLTHPRKKPPETIVRYVDRPVPAPSASLR